METATYKITYFGHKGENIRGCKDLLRACEDPSNCEDPENCVSEPIWDKKWVFYSAGVLLEYLGEEGGYGHKIDNMVIYFCFDYENSDSKPIVRTYQGGPIDGTNTLVADYHHSIVKGFSRLQEYLRAERNGNEVEFHMVLKSEVENERDREACHEDSFQVEFIQVGRRRSLK